LSTHVSPASDWHMADAMHVTRSPSISEHLVEQRLVSGFHWQSGYAMQAAVVVARYSQRVTQVSLALFVWHMDCSLQVSIEMASDGLTFREAHEATQTPCALLYMHRESELQVASVLYRSEHWRLQEPSLL